MTQILLRHFESLRLNDLLQKDEGEEERADHDLGPPRTKRALKDDGGLDDAEDENAENRSRHIPDTAAQERAADHDGGDGIQFETTTGIGIARLGVETIDDARERRAEATQC